VAKTLIYMFAFVCDVNVCLCFSCSNGMAIIHDAVETGNEAAVKNILAEDVSQVSAVLDDTPDQPLHLAAWQNQAGIARLLLEAGADVNARGDLGLTPLHYAARHGSLTAAQVLIEHGADLNARDDIGFSPLVTALRGREPECEHIAKVLLKRGAIPDLNTLVMQGKEKKIRALLKAEPSAIKNTSFPNDLLYDAVVFIHGRVYREAGFSKSARESAVIQKYQSLVLALLDAGADINAISSAHEPALFEALRFHDPAMARLLLEHGADVNQVGYISGEKIYSAWDVTRHKLMRALLLEFGFQTREDDV
jgi:ankyrin repeat protein